MPDATSPFPLPEDCTDRDRLKRAVFDFLDHKPDASLAFVDETTDRHRVKRAIIAGLTGDFYYHRKIRDVLVKAGLVVKRIERIHHHPIFELKLLRGDCDLPSDPTEVARRFRAFLKSAGLPIERDAISARLYGERIQCSFVFEFGAVGVLK